MDRARIIGAALAVVTLAGGAVGVGAALSAPAATADATSIGPSVAVSQTSIDPKIQVPAGNTLVAALRVDRGVQTYQCTDSAWTFLEPGATLENRHGTAVVLHSRGPVWVSTVDGSAVNAAAVPGASVPRTNAVPELLLKATVNRGDGALGHVSFIQRLHTHGGVAPTGACTDGTQVGVPYSAVYAFYAPESH
jgi:hypothetical protein